VLPIDFGAYQQLGRMQYPDSLPLNDKEVTSSPSNDVPARLHTTRSSTILAAQCVKATFFMVGEMAHSFPGNGAPRYEEGHTIGTHSEHHPVGFGKLRSNACTRKSTRLADVSAASAADSRYLAPVLRIPALSVPTSGERACRARADHLLADIVADDWHRDITPAKIIALAMSRLEQRQGILLLHDIIRDGCRATGLLQQLERTRFHVVASGAVGGLRSRDGAQARRGGCSLRASDDLAIDDGGTLRRCGRMPPMI